MRNTLASASMIIMYTVLGLLILQENCLAQNKPIHDAAKKGDLERVDQLITQGADVNAKGKNGYTALELASEWGYGKIVNLLLKNGAGANARTSPGGRALIYAAADGHIDIVKALLENGADPNVKRKRGTALFESSRDGNVGIVNLLLKNGADVNTPTNTGWTALIIAASNGYIDIVKALLENGAKVNLKTTHRGKTALYFASQGGHQDVISLLLSSGADVNAKTNDGRTALEVASRKGIASLLLSNGAIAKDIERNAGTLLRKDELQGKYDWNGSTTVKTIDGDVTYGLTTAQGMSGTAYEGHFLLGNLEVKGRVVVVSQGLIVTQKAKIRKQGSNTWKPMGRSQQNDLVKEVQSQLIMLDYNPGVADGIMGTKTRNAIKAYQKTNHLLENGKATIELLSHIKKSTEILLAQKRLKELGYYIGTVDGKWRESLETALKEWQLNSGLKVTGKINEPTKEKLRIAVK